jgi:hypothetical protein
MFAQAKEIGRWSVNRNAANVLGCCRTRNHIVGREPEKGQLSQKKRNRAMIKPTIQLVTYAGIIKKKKLKIEMWSTINAQNTAANPFLECRRLNLFLPFIESVSPL